MTALAHLILLALALPACAASLYLLALTLLSGAAAPPRRSLRRHYFDIVVPAHNEAAVISAVVANLRQLDWPVDQFRVVVVADNCSDATAALARAGGAKVLVRHDVARRGKGYALAHAFEILHTQAWADAIVVVDADSAASPGLLEAFAARLEAGAEAVQAHYGVLNAQDSWRTRLMAIALGAFHRVRSRGRERLQLSCGLRGNGWCVSRLLLGRVPYRAFSLAEDIEYGIELGLAGVRVHYADEALVAGLMVSGEAASGTQRRRWEDGRLQLIRSHTLPLLQAARRGGGRICLDLALDLWVLPLSWVLLNVAALALLAAWAVFWLPSVAAWLWIALACAVGLTLYVLRGWQLSGVGRRGAFDLLRAPFFVAWKLLLMLRTHDSARWVRTHREHP